MMLNRLTLSLSFLLLVVAAHGDLAYKTSEPYGENLKNLIVMVLVGVLVDYLRLKLEIPIPSTEKLGSAKKEIMPVCADKTETETKGFEKVTPRFEPSKQTPLPSEEEEKTTAREEEDEKIPEKQNEATKNLNKNSEQAFPDVSTQDEEDVSVVVEVEKIILTASTDLSTHNLEPVAPVEAPVECSEDKEQLVSCDFEDIIASLNRPNTTITRPRFYSDPTGRDDRWGRCSLDAEEESKEIIGERTPERTPEMPSVESLCNTKEIPEWFLPEEKINERKPMVFIGGVSASTTPMEVVYELKKQGFNVTVVPRIRYGVSFGFCPDLVLSSAEEVKTLLAMEKIWIKDRWVDVRPYVPKDEASSDKAPSPNSASVDTPCEQTTHANCIQEVNSNVFAGTSNVAIGPSYSSSPPNQMIPAPEVHEMSQNSFHGSPQMAFLNGYGSATFVDMNMSPPGSLCSTPTFIPSHAIPAPMMFPIPGFYAPQFPTEFVYPEQFAHQSAPCEQLTPEHQYN